MAQIWQKKEANFGLQLGQEEHPCFMRLWWVICTSLGLPPSISGSNCLCWWIRSSVSITGLSDRLRLDGGRDGEQNSWINWQINLYIQRPLGSSLSACKPLSSLLLKRTWITDVHAWYCHLLSPAESGNSVSLAPKLSLFCVRSMIDNGRIFSLGGRKMNPGGQC